VVAAAEKGSTIDALRILLHFHTWNEPGTVADIARRRGIKVDGGGGFHGGFDRLMAKADAKTLQGIAVELAAVYGIVEDYGPQDENLRRVATTYKLDLKKLRAAIEKELTPAAPSSMPPKAEAATKGKPAKKKPAGPLARKAKGKAKKAA
jgi:hypothetical protein